MAIQLSIRNMTKRYKTGEGVTGITMDVHKGELVTLLGPSGCGKTTVLRSIGGFLEPDSGEIIIEGRNVIKLPPEQRPTSMVFQGYNLWPHMTVYDNLAFGLKIRKTSKADIRQAVADVLQLVRLPGAEQKYPSELSGGQQQRVAVARSLLLKPAVLLLDEPFSALDAKLRHEMREELRDIQMQTGLTMVFVTHDQEEALSLSDRIVVMNHGNIEQIAAPQEIYDEPNSLYTAQFIGKMNFLKGVVKEDKLHIGRLIFPNPAEPIADPILAVRPEDIMLLAEEEEGIRGAIRQVMVLGHYAEVSVELSDYGVIRAFQPRDSVKELQSGQHVAVTFAKAIAYPNNQGETAAAGFDPASIVSQ